MISVACASRGNPDCASRIIGVASRRDICDAFFDVRAAAFTDVTEIPIYERRVGIRSRRQAV